MKAFPVAVGFALLFILVQDSIASPIIIPRVEQFEQSSKTVQKPAAASSDVRNNDDTRASKQDGELNRPEMLSSFFETTFKLFSMYDQRGPWQPIFLPQPPPVSN
jgi:hypothetical protein